MARSAVALGRELKGVEPMPAREARFQRITILFLTIGPLAGFVLAAVSLWGRGMSGLDAAILAVTYPLTAMGVTVGYHRLLTHRSFDAPRPIRSVLAIAGSLAIEGSVISWVADHRRHHAYADQEGDPHSPHVDMEDGLVGALKGLWFAHVGWLFAEEKTVRERWAPDLLKDPTMVRIDRAFPLLALISLVGPGVLGLVITGSIWGGITAFLWGGLARAFLVHHVTWSINSICHYFGTRPFQTPDQSTNNWPMALLAFGEGWHNNHHAFPTAAIHGIRRWEIDPSGLVIAALEKLGLARDVKRVTKKQLEAKLV